MKPIACSILLFLIIQFCFWLYRNSAPSRRFRSQNPEQTIIPAPRSKSRRKPAWVRKRVIRLAAAMPQAGCRTLALILNRHHFAQYGVSVGKTWVAQLLRTHRDEIYALRRLWKHRIPTPMPVNRVWGLDLTGKADERGQVHAILGMVDHGSRFALALRRVSHQSAWALLGYVCLAVARYGKPYAIRTDNGGAFAGKVFPWALQVLGIRHQRTLPGHPWQNGRVERFFGTLKHKLNGWAVKNSSDLQTSLQQFGLWYNHIRPHQHLNGQTPAECWNGIDPFHKPPRQIRWMSAWGGLLSGYYLRR